MTAGATRDTRATWLGRKSGEAVADFPPLDARADLHNFSGVFVPQYISRPEESRNLDGV
jgi:hypothetical protein